MKIIAVEALFCPLPIRRGKAAPTLAGQTRKSLDMLLIKVSTDKGLVGWGEAFAFYGGWLAARTVIETLVAPRCIGRDPMHRNTLVGDLQRQLHRLGRSGPVAWALSGLEIALWDLQGNALGVPLHALLGGARRSEVRCYASLLRYGSVSAVVDECARALARGFTALKIHETGLGEIEESARFTASAVDGEFMVDVNCAWSFDEAMAICARLSDAGVRLKWLEEPLYPPDDHAALQRLRASCGYAIAAGENAGSILDFASMSREGTVDFAQPSVAKLGGIEAVRRVADMMDGSATQVALHSPFIGPALLASLHLVAARVPDAMLESYFVDVEGNPFEAAVTPRAGTLRLPDGPGLGCDPDPVLLSRALRR